MGSSPTSAIHQRRAVAQWQSAVKSLTTPSSVRLIQPETHSTAAVEYMVKQVRFPPGPLGNTYGAGLCGRR